MKMLILVIMMLTLKAGYSQSLSKSVTQLRQRVLSDTSKYNEDDVIYNGWQSLNSKSYSKLFVVDAKYYYKLDIIDGKRVLEFANEFLDTLKVSKIIFLNDEDGTLIYGRRGSNGVVYINTKPTIKHNYFVAGLKKTNNYDQRRKGQLLILD